MNDCFPKLVPIPTRLARKGKESKERSLSVHKVGSYNVSVASTLEDLRKIDKEVFVVSDNVEELLKKHYFEGFGFIIAAFRDNEGKANNENRHLSRYRF